MPTDVDFHLPFTAPKPVPDAVEQAQRRGVDWAVQHGLLRPTDAAVGYFLAMRLADVAAGFCPKAGGPDLDLMTDVITWTAVCDDFFDGPAGDDPAFAAAVVAALTAVTGAKGPVTASAPAGAEGLAAATADLWARLHAPMTEQWRDRAGRSWARFLRSFLAEADARRARTVPDLAGYLALRRETMAMYVYLDAAERTGRYEVPERVLADPTLRRLSELQIDILAHCNDVHSVEHEEARGDTHNLVLVLEAGSRRPRGEVIEEIRRRVGGLTEEFLHNAAGIPGLLVRLSCDPYERMSTDRYIRAMTHQLRVTYDWSLATRRYAGQLAAGRRPEYLTHGAAPRGVRTGKAR
ncbi:MULTISPECIES: hypothetical protein [unclassified Kitasatospora]|uniref:terpene synthase family protein n=1 Tax=unclassified Kitasatospora TaxID=2633591 RepID=UPI00070BF43F|nr:MULTISPECIES: hypothetical protein [unclassified Kitasatospora]KQV19261.1 hypothetical protein ASC99_24255 [Kitasatospora sp. Root107]KRB77537.1 hypothetical protein ASE03_00455 [Kitasatospora sp. Root187]